MHSGPYNAPFLVTIYHPTHNHWNPSMYILWYITWNSLYILKLLECAHPFLLRNLFLSWIYCFTYRSLKWWFFFLFFSHTVWATRCEGDLPTPHWCFQTILHFFFFLLTSIEPQWVRFNTFYYSIIFTKSQNFFLGHFTMLFHVTISYSSLSYNFDLSQSELFICPCSISITFQIIFLKNNKTNKKTFSCLSI